MIKTEPLQQSIVEKHPTSSLSYLGAILDTAQDIINLITRMAVLQEGSIYCMNTLHREMSHILEG